MDEIFHGNSISCAALNNDMIVFSCKTGDLTFLSIKKDDGKEPKKLSTGKPIDYLDWKGSLLVFSSSDGNICSLIDTNTLQVIRTVRFEEPIVSIAISPKYCTITEYRVAIGTRNDILYLVTNDNQLNVKVDSQLNDVDYGNSMTDNGLVAVALGSGHVALYDEELKFKSRLAAHALNCYCVAIDPMASDKILTGGGDALASLWQVHSDISTCTKIFGQLEWPIHTISLYNGKLAIASDNDSHLLIFDVPVGDFWKPFPVEKIPLKSTFTSPICISMNQHGLMLASERSICFYPRK
jgi:WD40 repeat protein